MNDGAPERAGNAIVRLGSFWMISAEPHVMMRLKRLWGGIAKTTRAVHVMPSIVGGKDCAVACLSVYL